MIRTACTKLGISWLLSMTVALLAPGLSNVPSAHAEEPQATASGEYHTPLAGEPLHTVFMGETVDVAKRDRGNVSALTLGGTYYTPKQGSIAGSPIGAFYLKRDWESSRTRNIISIFVNELEYDKSFGNLELVTRFENNTIPGGQTETLNNKEIKGSSVEWGTLAASVGPGLRFKVAPFQVDNDLRIQLLAKAGYFYNGRTGDTNIFTKLPPSTPTVGAKLRLRYDGMRRNLLELPHEGLAFGVDLDANRRCNWSDYGNRLTGATYKKGDTQDYQQFSGYAYGVTTIPGLSEKNKFLTSIHGGTMDVKSADRYNAFRIGGGPLPGESDDLYRPDYPGTMFNNVIVSDYAMVAMEYRRELTFFLYLHLRETYIWANRATASGITNQVGFKEDHGWASTVGIDSGFLWDSSLYLGWSWDSGFIRDGKAGNGFILTWNKNF
jgi:hypothetical protein